MAVVVITGASSGIGEATARQLASEGHRLVLAARRIDRLEQLASELAAKTEVLVVQTDLLDPVAIDSLVQQAEARFGRIDVLINNAGMGGSSTWWDMDPSTIAQTVTTNLTAPIWAARAVLPGMRQRRQGHIINIASVAGHIGVTGLYSGTKFGLRGHTAALRREVMAEGINVSLVSPGYVRTEMTQGVRNRMPGPEIVAKAISNVIKRPKRDVVVPGFYRLLILMDRLFPFITDRVLSKRR
jgi:short-subunit dehydrogenase